MRKHAFTLVEVLVVIAIISIFTAMLMPNFSSSFERRKIASAVRGILDCAQLAGSSAVAENHTFRIYFNIDKRSYYLAAEPDPLNSPGNFDALMTEEGKEQELPEGAIFRDAKINDEEKAVGVFYISFFKDGSCEEALMHIEDFKENVVTLYFNPSFSTCSVFDGDVSATEIKDVKIESIKEKKSKKGKEGLHAR